jgi:preprotein translocase subunit SecE
MTSLVVRTRNFTMEVADELKKVTWPDWPQLRSATIVILVFCAIVAAIIKIMDLFASNVVSLIIGLFTS